MPRSTTDTTPPADDAPVPAPTLPEDCVSYDDVMGWAGRNPARVQAAYDAVLAGAASGHAQALTVALGDILRGFSA